MHGLKLACSKTMERSAMHSQRGGAQGFPPPAFYCSYHAALTGLCQPAQNPCFLAPTALLWTNWLGSWMEVHTELMAELPPWLCRDE